MATLCMHSHAPAWECIRNRWAEAITSSGENTHIGEWAGKSLQILASHEEAGVLFCRVGRHHFREITHGRTLHVFPRWSVGTRSNFPRTRQEKRKVKEGLQKTVPGCSGAVLG